jgi:hypothetical protein
MANETTLSARSSDAPTRRLGTTSGPRRIAIVHRTVRQPEDSDPNPRRRVQGRLELVVPDRRPKSQSTLGTRIGSCPNYAVGGCFAAAINVEVALSAVPGINVQIMPNVKIGFFDELDSAW